MRVQTHLISMPLAPPETPSIQIASLKAHLDRALHQKGRCRAYSAFFSILHELKGQACPEFHQTLRGLGEYLYLPLYLHRFGPLEFRSRTALRRLLKALRAFGEKPLSLPVILDLERATCRFLDRQVAPNLIARGLNLVGFTLNYHQLYSSLYAAEHLRRSFPHRNFLFVYGGFGASQPTAYNLLASLGAPGAVVVGEGEKKLELLVRSLEGLPQARARTALAAVSGLDPGIIAIGEKVDFTSRNPARHASQIESLSELALPDYDEYFTASRQARVGEKAPAASSAATEVFVEGSRGCFCACDFCALNRTWEGYRRRSAGQIVRDVLALIRRYPTVRVGFVDNVCDGWAEGYSRLLVRQGIRPQSFMELRANHPERFWTLLAQGGTESVQVGVEALSSPLLKKMGKGVKAVQNLAVHKYLAELGIKASSNLIIYHPASTLADVRETRRVLELIPHLAPFFMAEFELFAGSPLYEGLSGEEQAKLNPTRSHRLPSPAARYALEYSFEVPESLRLGRDIRRAWSTLARRYVRERARCRDAQPRLDVARVAPDTLRITDTRYREMIIHDFSGDAARIYDACHSGLKPGDVARITALSPGSVQARLTRFVQLKLMLRVDDAYLSLALRPRDQLLHRLFAPGGSGCEFKAGRPTPPADRGSGRRGRQSSWCAAE